MEMLSLGTIGFSDRFSQKEKSIFKLNFQSKQTVVHKYTK